jgi:hypothetical protein
MWAESGGESKIGEIEEKCRKAAEYIAKKLR